MSYKHIETLEEARKLADEVRYRSDFSAAEDEFYVKGFDNQCSPTLSASSMSIFPGILLLHIAHNYLIFYYLL